MARHKGKTGLSPSSLSLFQACERRYWHYKVNKSEKDADFKDDSTALRVGSAFHKVLEETNHELDGVTFPQVKAWIAEFGVGDEALRIMAMLAVYKDMHKRAGLKVIACEIELDLPEFIGYIDAIMVDDEEQWWISDNKTAAMFSSNLIPTLPSHPQLNLYAKYADKIAEQLGLDMKNFGGCRYRVTTKSRLKRNKSETDKEYFDRLKTSISSKDIVIPFTYLDPDRIGEVHSKVFAFTKRNKKEEAYKCNYSNCLQYFKPCPWFSRCHKWNFSEGSLEIVE